MPQPTVADVHAVDQPLTNISLAYLQRAENFIASRVFPTVQVAKQSDRYYIYTLSDWIRDEAQLRAPGTESAGSGYGLTTATYRCEEYAIHKDVPDQVRANADAGINPDRDATEFVTHRLLVKQEVDWATSCFSTGVWANDSTPSNLWSDYTASDPLDDVEDGKATILAATGFEPNTLVLGYEVFRQLKHHPDLVDRFKYTSADSLTEDMMAMLFGVDRILVAKSIRDSAQEGNTDSVGFNLGKHALLLHVAPNPGLLVPTAGYNFRWTGVSGGLGADIGIRRFRMDHLKSDRVEGEAAWDFKVVATDLGYLLDNVVA